MDKKKDILFLLQYFYPEYISSATLPFDTAQAFVNSGYTVSVICGFPKEYSLRNNVPKSEIFNGINIKRLKYLQLERTNIFGRLINYFSFTLAALLKIREFNYYKVIIVYSNPPVLPFIAALANKLFGVKVIFVSYDIYPEIAEATNVISSNSLISKMMKILNKITFKRLFKVIALSNEMKKFLLIHRQSLTEEQIEVIPNWYEDKGEARSKDDVDNELFEPLLKEKNFIVSYFGNMGTGQDIETIIDSIRILKEQKDIKFLFAGHGNKMPLLKKVIKEENLNNIYIYDFLHGDDFQDALAISDCFIVSLAEGITGLAVPSKTYSYMMAGRPIIAIMDEHSDIVRELIENEAGYNINNGDSFKLVDVIEELYHDIKKRKCMGKNCRNIFLQKYTKKICTQQYVHLLGKVLED